MDAGGAMLWGRVTYEMMESYWPAVARGDEEAARFWAGRIAVACGWPQEVARRQRA